MSDTNQDKTVRTPRLTIDQSAAPAGEVVDPKVEAPSRMTRSPMILMSHGSHQGYGGSHLELCRPSSQHHAWTVAGFVLAVLVLTLGLWDTLVIAFFVLIGAVIGQIRDGENGIVNFFGRLFSGR